MIAEQNIKNSHRCRFEIHQYRYYRPNSEKADDYNEDAFSL